MLSRMSGPAGTQAGKVLTIKGKGAPDVKNKGQFGNLKIRVAVEVPTEMNEAQTKAIGLGVHARVAARATGRHQTLLLVGAQGLGVHPRQLGGNADHVQRPVPIV